MSRRALHKRECELRVGSGTAPCYERRVRTRSARSTPRGVRGGDTIVSTVSYRDGLYYCSECDKKVRVPPGASVRHGFTTVRDGERERVLLIDGIEAHRCADREITIVSGAARPRHR